MRSWRERNEADRRSANPAARFAALLEEVAAVAQVDAENVGGDPYAWPPRGPLSDEERAEYERLRVLSRRLDYHASEVRAGIRAYPLIPVLDRAVGESGAAEMKDQFPKKCTCCARVHDEAAWKSLKLVGEMDDGEEVIEIRNCDGDGCFSSIAVLLGPSPARAS